LVGSQPTWADYYVKAIRHTLGSKPHGGDEAWPPRSHHSNRRRRAHRGAELEEQVTELLEQRAAISEVLHGTASSPHELQPVFDAILVSTTRLCRAVAGAFRLCEDTGLRLVARKGAPELLQRWSAPTLVEYSSGYGFLAAAWPPRFPGLCPWLAMCGARGYPRESVCAAVWFERQQCASMQ
jgi:hypothetical protein